MPTRVDSPSKPLFPFPTCYNSVVPFLLRPHPLYINRHILLFFKAGATNSCLPVPGINENDEGAWGSGRNL